LWERETSGPGPSHDVADVFKHLAHQCNGFGPDGLELQFHAANDHSLAAGCILRRQ
jgi:hypothetical protein